MPRKYNECLDRNGYCMTVYEDGEFAGNIILQNQIPEAVRGKLSQDLCHSLYLYGIQIGSKHRGKGLDLFLMNLVKRFANSVQKPLLLLACPLEKDRFSREKLMRFYRLHGFRKLNCSLDNCMIFHPREKS